MPHPRTLLLSTATGLIMTMAALTAQAQAVLDKGIETAVLTKDSALAGDCKPAAKEGTITILLGSTAPTTECSTSGRFLFPLASQFSQLPEGPFPVRLKQFNTIKSYTLTKAKAPQVLTSPTPTTPPLVTSATFETPATPQPGKPVVMPPPTPRVSPTPAKTTQINLSIWKLALPVDKKGGNTDAAMEIKTVTAQTVYQPYFEVTENGELHFKAPATGATTTGSKYARSELQEQNANGSPVAWTPDNGGTLQARATITSLPDTSDGPGSMVISHVRAIDGELARLSVNNGDVVVAEEKFGKTSTVTQYPLLDAKKQPLKITFGDIFQYTITVNAKTVRVEILSGATTYTAEYPVSSYWKGKTLSFGAGAYLGAGQAVKGAETVGTGTGELTIKMLKITH